MEQQDVCYLACQRADQPHLFDDDVDAQCALCGAAIYHRPHALSDIAGAVPVCLSCALSDADEHEAQGGKVTFTVTARTLREGADYLRLEAQGKAGGAAREEDARG